MNIPKFFSSRIGKDRRTALLLCEDSIKSKQSLKHSRLRWPRLVAMIAAASASVTLCVFATSNPPTAKPSKNVTGTGAPSVTPYVDIASAGPLAHVWIGNELSCQVQHMMDGNTHEFYPPNTIPGDCGTFIAMAGTLYAPDFNNHGLTYTQNLGARTVFTPISQTPVTGSGTTADPYKVVTGCWCPRHGT